MSNPGINRWGLNLFWYNFWFKDKSRQLTIHLDEIINKLVHVYINYGLYASKALFNNNYRFLIKNNELSSYRKTHDLLYFRFVEYKSRVSEETNLVKIRKKAWNVYKTKIWIMRYQSWLIINFYSFQPLKKRKNIKNIKNFFSKKSLNFLSEEVLLSSKLFLKYKLFFLLSLNSIATKKSYHFF